MQGRWDENNYAPLNTLNEKSQKMSLIHCFAVNSSASLSPTHRVSLTCSRCYFGFYF